MNRRRFLSSGLSALALAQPGLWSGAAYANTAERALILIELRGGNDGLNTVVPTRDPLYRHLRPTLAIPARTLLRLDDQRGFHPALAPLMPLWERGEVAVVEGVGVPGLHASHFRATRVWESGSGANAYWQGNWFGAALACRSFSQAAESVLAGHRCVRLTLDGFDTHHRQAERHAALLAAFAQGVAVMRAPLIAAGRWDDVVIMTTSEFGRSAAENDEGGTDHGAAAPHFVVGGGVRGGVSGAAVDLPAAGGSIAPALDARRLYATILSRWFGVPAETVLGRHFDTLPILTTSAHDQ